MNVTTRNQGKIAETNERYQPRQQRLAQDLVEDAGDWWLETGLKTQEKAQDRVFRNMRADTRQAQNLANRMMPGTKQMLRRGAAAIGETDRAILDQISASDRLAGRMDSDAERAMAAAFAGPQDALMKGLVSNAEARVANAGRMTDGELNRISQTALAGYASRGLTRSGRAIGAELMNRSEAIRKREMEDLSMAGQVRGLYEQASEGLRGFAGQTGNLANTARGNAAAAAQTAGAFFSDRQNTINGQRAALTMALTNPDPGQWPTFGTDPQSLNMAQTMGYGQDVNNTNYNARASANMTNAQNQAATQAGQQQMIGAGAGAAAGIAAAGIMAL